MNDQREELVTGLNLAASLSVNIGRAADELQRTAERMAASFDRLQDETPVETSVVASAKGVAGGLTLVSFGKPDKGTTWEVLTWAWGGIEPFTSTVNPTQTALFVAGNASTAAGLVSNVVSWSVNGGNGAVDFNPGSIMVNAAEYLFVIASGILATETLTASCRIRVRNAPTVSEE